MHVTLGNVGISSYSSNQLYTLQVVLPSDKEVVDFQPNYDEIQKFPGTGLIITGASSAESEFDFYTRYFCPKFGIYEVLNAQSFSKYYNIENFRLFMHEVKVIHGINRTKHLFIICKLLKEKNHYWCKVKIKIVSKF